MKELKSILGLIVLLAGAFVLYKVFPVYWANFKLEQMLDEQAVALTYEKKSNSEVAALIAEKARNFNVLITPEQVKVERTAADLGISVSYTVTLDLPLHPLDLNFDAATRNHNVMK